MRGKLDTDPSRSMLVRILCCGWMLLCANCVLSFSCKQSSRHWFDISSIGSETKWTRSHLYELGTRTELVSKCRRQPGSNGVVSLFMRDRSSSYWFSVGDLVKVVDDVHTNNRNLKGRTGKVVETWEKCDVDPTCCCAEQVDTDMAVRVFFENKNMNDTDNGDDNDGNEKHSDDSSFYYYFAEEELDKV